jgi:hypothetical protein
MYYYVKIKYSLIVTLSFTLHHERRQRPNSYVTNMAVTFLVLCVW